MDGEGGKSGNLLKREKGIIKATWKERPCILIGGSFFYYEHHTDYTPKGVIHLNGCQVFEVDEKRLKRKHVFCIHTPSDGEIYLAGKDDTEKLEWLSYVKQATSKNPSAPPDKELIRKFKPYSISNRVLETLAKMGNRGKTLKDYMSDDTLVIVEAVQTFVKQYSGEEKAAALEKLAISISTKLALLYRDKTLSTQYISMMKAPIREIISKLIDGYEIPFTFSSYEVIQNIRELQKIVFQILRPYLPEKSMNKITELFNFVCNEELLDDFFEKKKWKECEVLALTLRKLWDSGGFD